MNFSDMYRVMVRLEGKKNFQGTGSSDGYITVESNKIYQSFYTKENAEKLAESMRKDGFEVKVQK